MRILVVLTGGTVGSQQKNGVINVGSCALTEHYTRHFGGDVEFETAAPVTILSENSNDTFYSTLISYLLRTDLTLFDGIIVTHGTDTLSYTAPLAAMALRHIRIPIVFVSANYILENPKSNGYANFAGAVAYIQNGGRGVVAAYQNPKGQTAVHLATRLNEADSFTDSFTSAGNRVLAYTDGSTVEFTNEAFLPTQEQLAKSLPALFHGAAAYPNKIFKITPYPSMNYDGFDVQKTGAAAVLHTLYHSGTAEATENGDGLPRFIKRCQEQNIAVFVSAVKRSDSVYATAERILDAGGIPLYGLTAESALARLKTAYNCGTENPKALAQQNLYYEEFVNV